MAPGARLRVEIGKRAFCLFNLDGQFYALADRCPHEGASLSAGSIAGIVESDGPGT